jgi:cytochrome c
VNSFRMAILASFGLMILVSPVPAAEGDAARGQRLFSNCAACHSLKPNRNMTGPSLSGLWGRGRKSIELYTLFHGHAISQSSLGRQDPK